MATVYTLLFFVKGGVKVGNNIQPSDAVRVGAVIAILLAFVSALIVMVIEYIQHGTNTILPTLITTIITSVLIYATNALSVHQGSSITQQSQQVTTETNQQVAQTAISSVSNTTAQTTAVEANTAATDKNTSVMQGHP